MNDKLASAEEIAQKLYKYDVQAEKLDGLKQIDELQLKKYKNEGFLAVANVLSQAEVKEVSDAIGDIIHKRIEGPRLQYEFSMNESYARPEDGKPKSEQDIKTPEDRENALRKICDFVKADSRLEAIAYKQELIEVVEKLLGDKAVLIQDMALLKPPFGGSEKPWHQDMAYGGLTFDKPLVGVWIAIDDAEIDNGCMHVIPGSHSLGGTPHYAVRDWQLCDSSIPVDKDVTVPLQKGGAMFFHGMLYHGTPANLSSKRRRALQLHYKAASAEKITPQEYKRMYTNEMSGAEC